MLESLATAAVGGALVLLGQLIPPIATHFLIERKSDRTLRREKVFEVIEVAYQVDRWLDSQQSYYLFGRDQNLEPSPEWKLRSLVAIHFPELAEELETFRLNCLHYMVWATGDAARARQNNDLQPAIETYKDVYPAYHASFDRFVTAALSTMNESSKPTPTKVPSAAQKST